MTEMRKCNITKGRQYEYFSEREKNKSDIYELKVDLRREDHLYSINIVHLLLMCENLQKLELKGVKLTIEENELFRVEISSIKEITVEVDQFTEKLEKYLNECCPKCEVFVVQKRGDVAQSEVYLVQKKDSDSYMVNHELANKNQPDFPTIERLLRKHAEVDSLTFDKNAWNEINQTFKAKLDPIDFIAQKLPELRRISAKGLDDEDPINIEIVKGFFKKFSKLVEFDSLPVSVHFLESDFPGFEGVEECIISCDFKDSCLEVEDIPVSVRLYKLVDQFKERNVVLLTVIAPFLHLDIGRILYNYRNLKGFILDATRFKYKNKDKLIRTYPSLVYVELDVPKMSALKSALRQFMMSCPKLLKFEEVESLSAPLILTTKKEKKIKVADPKENVQLHDEGEKNKLLIDYIGKNLATSESGTDKFGKLFEEGFDINDNTRIYEHAQKSDDVDDFAKLLEASFNASDSVSKTNNSQNNVGSVNSEKPLEKTHSADDNVNNDNDKRSSDNVDDFEKLLEASFNASDSVSNTNSPQNNAVAANSEKPLKEAYSTDDNLNNDKYAQKNKNTHNVERSFEDSLNADGGVDSAEILQHSEKLDGPEKLFEDNLNVHDNVTIINDSQSNGEADNCQDVPEENTNNNDKVNGCEDAPENKNFEPFEKLSKDNFNTNDNADNTEDLLHSDKSDDFENPPENSLTANDNVVDVSSSQSNGEITILEKPLANDSKTNEQTDNNEDAQRNKKANIKHNGTGVKKTKKKQIRNPAGEQQPQ